MFVLTFVSKIFKAKIKNRLESFFFFFTMHKVATIAQYGFQQENFPEQALLDIKGNLLDNIKNKFGRFLDLRKAFDTVQRNILIRKVEFSGIRGVVLTIKMFLKQSLGISNN